jgi:hypothetical protein
MQSAMQNMSTVQKAAPFLSVQWVMQVHKQKILKGEWQEWSLY